MLGSSIPQRVVVGIMSFLGIVVSFLMRACLSVAITEMVIPMNKTGQEVESLVYSNGTISIESESVLESVSFSYIFLSHIQIIHMHYAITLDNTRK